MNSVNSKFLVLLFVGLFLNLPVWSQVSEETRNDETLTKGIEILRKYFLEGGSWYVDQPLLDENVKGLIHFVEDEPVDSVLKNIVNVLDSNRIFVARLPENVADSLSVPGFYPYLLLEKDIEKAGVQLQNFYQNKQIIVPEEFTSNLEDRLPLIPEGKGMQLFSNSVYSIPENLQIPDVIPDSMLNSSENFRELQVKDSLRSLYIENKRVAYNDSIVNSYVDSLILDIKSKQFVQDFESRKKRMVDSVNVNNYEILKAYNDSIVNAVNDSIFTILSTLVEYADYIDTTQISIINLAGDSTNIPLKNNTKTYTRVWLKNAQNDSLSILVKNTDKRGMQIVIDDGITFTRFKAKETKQFDFTTLAKEINDFNGVANIYELETPWRIGGDGSVGFSQTYLQNWKKGGQSAISSLLVLKGFANYSRDDGKIKLENNAEIRNGWIKPGGKGSEIQKNDDNFEITSRFSVSAFKRWYYSAEFNFETQFFRGYRYPTESNPDPISTFLSPARTFFKIGMEYKPNSNFSLLLSPLTIKNVYVRDTMLIDQTKFGVEANRKSFWEPGLNADVKFRKRLTDDISFETKYKMFINYKAPFRKFDINWENQMDMRLNDYINLRLMVHLIYDDDVLFPVYDANDVKIGDEPKLQVKEFLTVGFVYRINHKVLKTKRVR